MVMVKIMNKTEILQILNDWNFWHHNQRTGISRPTYLTKLSSLFSSNQVIVITGPRRAGKSTIMRQMALQLINAGNDPKSIMHVNFEDPRFTELNVALLDQIFKVYCEHINPQNNPLPTLFLDEIQEVDGFEKWVRTMHELGKAKIIISGSNAKLLSRELGTLLTGRHLDMEVFPLSFNEFLSFNNIENVDLNDTLGLSNKENSIKNAFRKYLEYGAFPEVVLSQQEQKKEIMLSYFDDITTKDLLLRFKIRKIHELMSVVKYYLSNVAALATFKSLERALDLSLNSIKKYTDYLEQAYLIFSLKRFSFKVKEQEKSPRKMYAIDTGLCNTIGFRFSENLGQLAENLVFIALKRRQALDSSIELFYWKDDLHREVDFVVKQELQVKHLIQVCWNLHDEKTKIRELRSLQKAMLELNTTSATIITEEAEGEEIVGNTPIKLVPLWKWLLSNQLQ
jgi:uncharacterized protein